MSLSQKGNTSHASTQLSRKPQLLVKKYGGTSVGSVDRIEALADRLLQDRQNGEWPIVVVSAMAGETNRLVSLGEQIYPHHRGPAYDMLLATGEQTSVALLSMALEKRGQKTKPLLAHQLRIVTDGLFSKARIQSIDVSKIHRAVEQGQVPVIAGFQGVSGDEITTLGRGGSDTSAVAIAAALGHDQCEIFTDVVAVCSADPRLVPKAREMNKLSFEEMMEMASLGSKVLHYRSVELAAKHNVRIHLRSTFQLRSGTWIVPEGECMENPLVTSVTHDPATVIIRGEGLGANQTVLGELFTSLSRQGVVVDIITQSGENGSLAFSVSEEDAHPAENIARQILGASAKVSVIKDVAKISVVGMGMKTHPGVAAQFFSTLHAAHAHIYLVTTSEIKISAVIKKADLDQVATRLHTDFGLDKTE